ncbi:class II aldolase/adducin family protein [Cohnella rhizosphaerae]|uniref:Class II aldolase/adducin family protein n=1 Tax=Cohnella rhizosphaerae TaxID=1457232 RepID=A0A9X4QS01_9BACL|nr:class II aldolase/adducin family protein [Cohnella rhizosphaerae]MDG0808813.1 class II aldolase/adducin family protein [Cohnella rhizosphaerae]
MCDFIRRSYEQRLFTSTQGTFSVKLSEDVFLITPHGLDRKYLEPEDLVLIREGSAEQGKQPSRSILLHRAIYAQQPHVGSVLVAHSPYTMAFALTDRPFESKTIPEAYILLRGMPKLPFESVYEAVGGGGGAIQAGRTARARREQLRHRDGQQPAERLRPAGGGGVQRQIDHRIGESRRDRPYGRRQHPGHRAGVRAVTVYLRLLPKYKGADGASASAALFAFTDSAFKIDR